MAGEITTIVGAILALADAVRMLAQRRGRGKHVLPVISILGIAIIVLGVLALVGAKPLASLLP